MNIRQSRSADGDRVVEIWRTAVDATHHFLTPEDRLAIDREVQAFLPFVLLCVAVDDGNRAVGFMLVENDSLEALFVDPLFHGRGIGRALVAHALQGKRFITTEVNEQNEQATAFYKHLGFVRIGRSEFDGQGRDYPLVQMRLDCSSNRR